MRKYIVQYIETNCLERQIEADSEEDAEQKMLEMLCSGKLHITEAQLLKSECKAIVEVQETKVD